MIRAVFFDAGNTLVRMNYEAIAEALVARGIRVTAAGVQPASASGSGATSSSSSTRPR